jgi:peptidoglycan/xylan/chitin deacetylase (PgdA/CDA1 family)
MADYGIEFGSHTCTHPELTAISEDACSDEITRSRADLQTMLGREIVSFCYPRGKLNDGVVKMVEDAGYSCAVVTPGRSPIPLCRHTLRRIGIYQRNTQLTFRLKLVPFVRRNYERLNRFF